MPFLLSAKYNFDPPRAAADGGRHDYFKITMEDVLVSAWQPSAADGGTHEVGHWMDTNTPSAAGNGHAGEFPWQLSLRTSGAHIGATESNLIYSGESGGLNESFSKNDMDLIWADAHSADTQPNPPSWGLDRIDQSPTHDFAAWLAI